MKERDRNLFLWILSCNTNSPISFSAEEKVRKETGPYANYCRDETNGDRKPDNGIAIIVQAGLLALIKPYIREGESNGMEHDERQGEVSAKERGKREGGGRDWHGGGEAR